MPEQMPTFAFTKKENSIVKRLTTPAKAKYQNQILEGIALWDTGATITCISNHIVNSLKLIPLGKNQIKTPSGFKEVNTYLIDVILPNNVGVQNVLVCDSDIGEQGIDFLIGMDIITLGDFVVNNHNGLTTFSFRIPSKECTDYVLKTNIQNKIGQHGQGKRKRK